MIIGFRRPEPNPGFSKPQPSSSTSNLKQGGFRVGAVAGTAMLPVLLDILSGDKPPCFVSGGGLGVERRGRLLATPQLADPKT
jgi:hypothetical protein